MVLPRLILGTALALVVAAPAQAPTDRRRRHHRQAHPARRRPRQGPLQRLGRLAVPPDRTRRRRLGGRRRQAAVRRRHRPRGRPHGRRLRPRRRPVPVRLRDAARAPAGRRERRLGQRRPARLHARQRDLRAARLRAAEAARPQAGAEPGLPRRALRLLGLAQVEPRALARHEAPDPRARRRRLARLPRRAQPDHLRRRGLLAALTPGRQQLRRDPPLRRPRRAGGHADCRHRGRASPTTAAPRTTPSAPRSTASAGCASSPRRASGCKGVDPFRRRRRGRTPSRRRPP